jgi:putative flavoprotein involved in K+ transport
VQTRDLDGFVAEGAKTKSGVIPADVVVLATGYLGLDALVRRLFGEAIAERVGPVWGIDEKRQELRNMWTRTGQPGLWFIAGSFAQCRIYSKYLALQIKAVEEDLIPGQNSSPTRLLEDTT